MLGIRRKDIRVDQALRPLCLTHTLDLGKIAVYMYARQMWNGMSPVRTIVNLVTVCRESPPKDSGCTGSMLEGVCRGDMIFSVFSDHLA